MISMKTPDGIKKGLECCAEDECFGERENCPYSGEPSLCVGSMCVDALAYIQQLERERDALLKDLKATDPCDNCKHCGDNCKDCEEDEHWEWRGVKEETP